jgi:negative regulator of flagellin synthesis FlgM
MTRKTDEDRDTAMNNIDRISHEAARTYLQSTDAARTAAAQISAHRAAASARARGQAHTTDTVEFSDTARSLAAARQVVDAAPDVRTDKVEAIKNKIADGTYQVPARVLARKMLTGRD